MAIFCGGFYIIIFEYDASTILSKEVKLRLTSLDNNFKILHLEGNLMQVRLKYVSVGSQLNVGQDIFLSFVRFWGSF